MPDVRPSTSPKPVDVSAGTWGRRLRWFGAEFLVVVSGVLVAVALNAWYQGRRDAATEATYLALLSRDVEHTMADLREAAAFERSQELNGLSGPELETRRTRARLGPTGARGAPRSADGHPLEGDLRGPAQHREPGSDREPGPA